MHESSRSEAELAMKCYQTFLFTLKAVSTGLDREILSAEYMKIWEIVQAVAADDRTLNVSPAELQANDSQMLPAMRQNIQKTMQDNMRTERELAMMLLRAASGFVVRDDAAE